jgi:hypothetical protein
MNIIGDNWIHPGRLVCFGWLVPQGRQVYEQPVTSFYPCRHFESNT